MKAIKQILTATWHAGQWFYRLPREHKGYIIILTYIAILVSVIVLRDMAKPVEYQRVLSVEEANAQETEKPVMIEVEITWDRSRIDQEIEKKAKEYGTSAATLKRIVQCESGYVTDIQSNHVLKYGREKSFGLAQIHLPSHPDVSYEEAIDPAFAVDYLAKHYAAGTDKWSCK